MGAGLRLKEILRQRQMTIKQLSVITGISINTLYSITKRDSSKIDPAILSRIVAALGITEKEFYNFDIEIRPRVIFEGAVGLLTKFFDPYPEDGWDEMVEGLFISLEDRGYSFSETELALIHAYAQLNPEGKQKAVERVEELTEIPKYKKAAESDDVFDDEDSIEDRIQQAYDEGYEDAKAEYEHSFNPDDTDYLE